MDFSEEQKLNSPFVLIAFSIGAIGAFVGISLTLYEAYQSDENIYSIIWMLFFLLAVEGLAYYMVFQTELKTAVGGEGFSYKYFPFVRTLKTIPFNEITNWQIRTIRNLKEFGGYGYKKNIFKRKTGFIMGSKDVLELNLINNKTLIFSTNNSYMISSALKKYIGEKEIKKGI